jgi:hypothetical protein
MKTNPISGLAVHARAITATRHLIVRRAWLWTGFLAFGAIAFCLHPAQAAVAEAWVQRYRSEAGLSGNAYKVATDVAGNVIVAGSTANQTVAGSDMLIIKYSGAGVPLWTNRYNNSGASAVAVDGSGNVFVTGFSDGNDATIAFSGAGVPLWTNRHNATTTAVAVDVRGKAFVTGSSVGSAGDLDYATIAYSAKGMPLWTNRYNGPGNSSDIARAVAVDSSGNVFITGSSHWSQSFADSATIAYSGAGRPLWTNRYNGTTTAMALDVSGNVFVAGFSAGSGGDWDYATIAFSRPGGRADVDQPLQWTCQRVGLRPCRGGGRQRQRVCDRFVRVFIWRRRRQ